MVRQCGPFGFQNEQLPHPEGVIAKNLKFWLYWANVLAISLQLLTKVKIVVNDN